MGRKSRTLGARALRAGALGVFGALLYHQYQLRSLGSRSVEVPDGFWRDCMKKRSYAAAATEQFPPVYDVCVLGGGVTGLYTAVDAAQRGLRVVIVEHGDLGGDWLDPAEVGLLHGGFPHVQRAIRQRDPVHLAEAYQAMHDITVWERVAPGCVSRTVTQLPVTHSTERSEMQLSAVICSLLSAFAGPWQPWWCRSQQISKTPANDDEQHPAEDAAVKHVPFPHAVVAADAVLDHNAAVVALARTCRAMGGDILTYSNVETIRCVASKGMPCNQEHRADGCLPDGQPHAPMYEVTVSNVLDPSAPVATVACRTIVNATGPLVETYRLSLLEAAKEFRRCPSDPARVTVQRRYALGGATVGSGLVERMLGHTFFVVPRESLVRAATGMPALPETVEGVRSPAVMASSSLRAHSNVNLLPLPSVDAFLVGSAVTPLVDSDDGLVRQFSAREQKTMLFRVRHQLQMLGLDMTHASSLMFVSLPLLSLPSKIGLDTSLDIITQGYAILPRKRPHPANGASHPNADGEQHQQLINYTNTDPPLELTMTEAESPRAWHVVGGGAHHSRRIAKDVVDRILLQLHGTRDKCPACETSLLRLLVAESGASSTSLRESITYLVTETFASTVTDVVVRRTRAALLNPQQCSDVVVPAVADEMQRLLGWSNQRKQREIADARASLKHMTLSF